MRRTLYRLALQTTTDFWGRKGRKKQGVVTAKRRTTALVEVSEDWTVLAFWAACPFCCCCYCCCCFCYFAQFTVRQTYLSLLTPLSKSSSLFVFSSFVSALQIHKLSTDRLFRRIRWCELSLRKRPTIAEIMILAGFLFAFQFFFLFVWCDEISPSSTDMITLGSLQYSIFGIKFHYSKRLSFMNIRRQNCEPVFVLVREQEYIRIWFELAWACHDQCWTSKVPTMWTNDQL